MLATLTDQERSNKQAEGEGRRTEGERAERRGQEERQWLLERQHSNVLGYNPFEEEGSEEHQQPLEVRTDPLPVIER